MQCTSLLLNTLPFIIVLSVNLSVLRFFDVESVYKHSLGLGVRPIQASWKIDATVQQDREKERERRGQTRKLSVHPQYRHHQHKINTWMKARRRGGLAANVRTYLVYDGVILATHSISVTTPSSRNNSICQRQASARNAALIDCRHSVDDPATKINERSAWYQADTEAREQ